MVAAAQPSQPEDDGGGGSKNPPPKATATLTVVGGKQKRGVRAEFDLAHVKTLGSYAASFQEMASALSTTKQTIISRLEERGDFFNSYQAGLSETKLKLRHRQLQLAMEGDCKMLTWLGMQLLQQRNKSNEQHEVKQGERTVVFTISQNDDGSDEEQVLEESTKPGVATPIEVTTDERN